MCPFWYYNSMNRLECINVWTSLAIWLNKTLLLHQLGVCLLATFLQPQNWLLLISVNKQVWYSLFSSRTFQSSFQFYNPCLCSVVEFGLGTHILTGKGFSYGGLNGDFTLSILIKTFWHVSSVEGLHAMTNVLPSILQLKLAHATT